jgi:hypothetical protein
VGEPVIELVVGKLNDEDKKKITELEKEMAEVKTSSKDAEDILYLYPDNETQKARLAELKNRHLAIWRQFEQIRDRVEKPRELRERRERLLTRLFLDNLSVFRQGLDYYMFESNRPEYAERLMKRWDQIVEETEVNPCAP